MNPESVWRKTTFKLLQGKRELSEGYWALLEPMKSFYVHVLLTLFKTDTFVTGTMLSNREWGEVVCESEVSVKWELNR